MPWRRSPGSSTIRSTERTGGTPPGAAVRIAAIYAVFGCAWVLGSDLLTAWLAADPGTTSLLQTAKGWAFVLLSAVLVYWLVARERDRWRRTADSLEEARSLYRRVVATISDAVLLVHVPTRTIADCNPAALEMLGYDRDELVGAPSEILHVDREHYERFAAEGDPVLAQGEPFRTRWTLRRKNGEVFRTEQVVGLLEPAGDEEPEYAVSVIRDVSERNRREEELEASRRALRRSRDLLQRYAEHLTRAREQERADIAREIHDELGQALTGLKMQLAQLRRRLEAGEEISPAALDPSLELILATVAQVRELSSSLRPAALDQLGLRDGLEWLVEQFGERTGLEVAYDPGDVELDLDEETSIHVYRLVQEALTNAARHAEAEHVRVEVSAADGDLLVQVLDDGVGFDLREPGDAPDSHGLLGMQERAHLVDGTLTLDNRASGGARVGLRFPRPAT